MAEVKPKVGSMSRRDIYAEIFEDLKYKRLPGPHRLVRLLERLASLDRSTVPIVWNELEKAAKEEFGMTLFERSQIELYAETGNPSAN